MPETKKEIKDNIINSIDTLADLLRITHSKMGVEESIWQQDEIEELKAKILQLTNKLI